MAGSSFSVTPSSSDMALVEAGQSGSSPTISLVPPARSWGSSPSIMVPDTDMRTFALADSLSHSRNSSLACTRLVIRTSRWPRLGR
eukprot:1135284-Lingulodinium_polyedra.AAC.1